MPYISLIRRAPLLLLATAAMLIVLGCARLAQPFKAEDPLRLYLRSDTARLRPGEALVVEVLLVNTSSEPILSAWLNHRSLNFYLRSPYLAEPVRIIPVYSEKEPPIVVQELKGDGLWSRQFVFTQATSTSGTYTLTAAFHQDPDGALPSHYFATAAPLEFRVDGEWAARRDRNGVLLKEEAIRLARNKAGAPDSRAEARLIINEAGFYDWFIRLTAPGGEQRAFLVNPYLAGVRQEADPAAFPERQEEAVPKVMKRDQ